LPFDIAYRKIKKFKPFLPKWEHGTAKLNEFDISEFMDDFYKKNYTSIKDIDIYDEWEKIPETEKQYYIDRANQRKEDENAKWKELIDAGEVPPLSEISVNELCYHLTEIVGRYVQCVEIINIYQATEEEKNYSDESSDNSDMNCCKSSGSYHIIMTDPKWLIGISEKSDGTTSYEQDFGGRVQWTPQTHIQGYFPTSFRLRTNVLKQLRYNPRFAPNFFSDLRLPIEIFTKIIVELANTSFNELVVPPWEVILMQYDGYENKKKRKRRNMDNDEELHKVAKKGRFVN